MTNQRIKISSIVENQLPQYVKEEFPLVSEFLKQYYISLENQSGSYDLLQNIDFYIKIDNLTNLVDHAILTSDINFFDSSITVESTSGFPESYGLLLIDSEIITYTSKTEKTFEGCIRGFSGVTSYQNKKDELTFSLSEASEHSEGTKVVNLSVLFLNEFLTKIKNQFSPGFENRSLYSDLNENIFIKQSIDFYSSKGTDNSFKILFGALYGEKVEIIKPRDYLIQPSDAQYRITADFVVESIEGNVENLVNKTIYQDYSSSQGTVTKVEKIIRESKEYYILSLDYDYDKDILPTGTIFGKFSITPKTKLINSAIINSKTLEVDSTVGFPKENGNLIVYLENGNILNISYKSKTINQFIDCVGIDEEIQITNEVILDEFTYGYDSDQIIKFRILGVLSDLKIPKSSHLHSKSDPILIKSLGDSSTSVKNTNWFFNIPITYKVKSIQKIGLTNFTYDVETFDQNYFKVGDSVTFISSNKQLIGKITSFNNETSFTVKFGDSAIDMILDLDYTVHKNIAFPSFVNDSSSNKYTSDIQNIYLNNSDTYVASSSLPSYEGLEILDNNRSVVFSGTFNEEEIITINSHGLYTGDSITYFPSSDDSLNISSGIYFAKKINSNQIKIARSRNNIFTNNFIKISGTAIGGRFELTEFSNKNINSQRLLRKISNPEDSSLFYETNPGLIGIFINGVEILNYKSKDKIFYGGIDKIIPTSPGSDYDIINPPVLTISDPIGFGAEGYCSVNGSLERIDIIDPGFDYLEIPKIQITGGNGVDASADANLISFDHIVDFDSQKNVNLTPDDTIEFSFHHKFRDNEELVYNSNNQSSIGGLISNSTYIVSVKDEYKIQLYKSISDATVGINTINLTSYGLGNHQFRSKNKKKKIGSITINNSGKNYQNKLTTTNSSGINTSSNTINIKNHGYQSGEIIVYNSTETPIGGLSSSFSYYLTKIDENNFKLSSIGINTLGFTTSYFYDTKQFISLSSFGSGVHKFNYPEIKVSISGKIGISTFGGQNFNAVLQPIFRGEIQSVFVSSSGSQYGCEDILNFNRQPEINLYSGSGCQLTPIISNGNIVDVIINSSGSGYNSPPKIQVFGSGSGAVLVPVISNGIVIDVKISNPGIGYLKDDTTIAVISSGKGVKFESRIETWTINLVERLIQNSQISNDDGILTLGLNNKYGLQYTHAYSPRYLRSLVQGTSFRNGEKIYTQDLQFNVREVTAFSHSPIIGWAYDGNPIYGPYGFLNQSGNSDIKCLKTGYELKNASDVNRPNLNLFSLGSFVEDYEYTGNGDLDSHNGRFCVTPEYPNGTYAYFLSINPDFVDSGGLFDNYKSPLFPYIIGNTYKSKPIDFNFQKKSNQDDININSEGWRRNISPYNILNDIDSYPAIKNLNAVKNDTSEVSNVFSGSVDSVGILTGGENYKIGDQIIFDSKLGSGAKAVVSEILGKPISQISVATSQFDDVKLYPFNQSFIGFCTIPHGFLNNDFITFTGKYDYNKSGSILVENNTLSLTSGIGSASHTGLVTYFNVSGNLNFPQIRENDIYKIGEEEIKILNIDSKSSRIRVLRNQNNTIGLVSYFSGSLIEEKSRKFRLNFGISTSYNYNIDKELYFNPVESVGLGTTSGVGIVSTIYFSNPGSGKTQISIPTQSIYIEDHNLNTGDELTYSSNGGSSLGVSTNGVSAFNLLGNEKIYATKISNNLIGISTIRVGFNSTGNIVSIGTESVSGLLYFNSIGTGNNHSFKTNYQNTLSGSINKNTVTVSTSQTHGLKINDEVFVKVTSGIETSFIIKYNDHNRTTIINEQNFSSIVDSNLLIQNHNILNTQKVIFNSLSPSPELENNKIYYVIVIDKNKVRLASSYYDAINFKHIIISSTCSGTISPINPPIKVIKDQDIIFDVSDSSLSFTNNEVNYPSFDLKFYKDQNFISEYYPYDKSSLVKIEKNGVIGVSTNSKVTIRISESFSDSIYYSLVPINLRLNNDFKKQIQNDLETNKSNQIIVLESVYTGLHKIVGISSSTFNYNIIDFPENPIYNSDVIYYTNSKSSSGAITKVSIKNGGKYNYLPSITSIKTIQGKNSVLISESNSIGKVKGFNIEGIGYDYSIDNSIRPLAKLPDILQVEVLSSFDKIGISSSGKGYTNSSPSLVVLDGLTNEVIDDVDLQYSVKDSKVTIIKNTTKLNDIQPIIIPVNNTNGIKINNISFNNSTKEVIVTLGSSFNSISDFPFFVGEEVIIEGVSVGIETTGKGYNSSNYDYSLFTITSVDPKIGGIGATVSYSLNSYLIGSEYPGNFNSVFSFGRITPKSYFPIFTSTIKKGDFYPGEIVYSNFSEGKVIDWDSNNNILKISSVDEFKVGESIIGKSSETTSIIKNINEFICEYVVDSFSPRRKGWNSETGFLNNNFQRIHDSDYYQYFSYEIRSKKDYNTWNDSVSSLNHTAGFKKFSNVILESDYNISGINTEQNDGDFVGISDISSEISLNCVNDYDLVSENSLIIDNQPYSNEIIFGSVELQDYIESVGNRVLLIDDFSNQFNSNPRSTEFSIIDDFKLDTFRAKKYIISISDKSDENIKQLSSLSLIYDNTSAYLNQYGIYSQSNLGSFDFNIFGSLGNLTFYPVNFKFNDYHLKMFSFSLGDDIVGVGTINLGNVSELKTNKITIAQGTSTAQKVVGIATTQRSFKVLVQIGATDSSYYEYEEIICIHNDNDVFISEYGKITTDTTSPLSSSGIGTYNAYISGSEVVLDFIPNQTTSVGYNINTFVVSISNSSYTGIGTQILSASKIQSNTVSISSSPTPSSNIVHSYSNTDYDSSYFIVQVEDKTNLEYQISEIILSSNSINTFGSEYGKIQTSNSLGVITSGISGSNAVLYFTPIKDIEVDVKIFSVNIGLNLFSAEYTLTSGSINYDYGSYTGSNNDIKKSFDLKHKNLPIFERYFNASSLDVVDLNENIIKIPYNFYVTGERIEYIYSDSDDNLPIGIGTTVIPGIGTTDKLPQSLYVVKIDDVNIKVSASASEALNPIPSVLDLTSVGVGSNHKFVSTKQNEKVLISIDNVIQSPIVSTAVTTSVSKNIGAFESKINVSDVSLIYGGDLIKINEEIMKVVSVGVGSTNTIDVLRPWFGTKLSSHSLNSLVTKIYGNYNILDNIIHFSEPPYGKVPILNPTNKPDEIDYTGIATGSSFSGRVFLRSAEDSINESYYSNYIFDDISENFNGSKKVFTLKNNGNDITGISTSNAIVLINEIFQTPSSLIESNNYDLQEYVGVTSISFTGIANSSTYDVNLASVPRGGIILSVGSSQGYGYQPLISAGGTAVVSSAGTIQSISIGNSGSGYRSGIQTNVRVGIRTETSIQFVGIASIVNGSVVSVAITNPGIGYTDYSLLRTTSTNSVVSSGSTIIYLSNLDNITSGNYISVGTALTNVSISGVGTTSVTIGTGSTVPYLISSGETVVIKYYNPPVVVFDSPLSYSNLPLIYSSQSISGVGTGAKIDIIVGQGSSIISFEITNFGYGYKPNEILTILSSDNIGIPTNSSLSFSEFQLSIESVYSDKFSSWTIGDLQVIDPIEQLFDDKRRSFPIIINGNQTTIRSKKGSYNDPQSSLLIFINDILQVPGNGYVFNGGSSITFTEPPRRGDTCKILFYKGTGDIDTVNVDVLESIKVGDNVKIMSDNLNDIQDSRNVLEIISSDSINTNLYLGPGLLNNQNFIRPLTWCKQTEDLFIDGKYVTKERIFYEPYIQPTTNIIKNVSLSSTEIYVESVKAFFDSEREYLHNGTNEKPQNKIVIISQDSIESAILSPNVSIAGTISSIDVSYGGIGYSTTPTISISSPIGVGESGKSYAEAVITGTSISSINVVNGGFGYTSTNPPLVLISSPSSNIEIINDVSYEGDYGIITGINTVSVGVASTGLVFDFFVPPSSPLRDSKSVKVGVATTGISGIQTGYYFVIKNSNVGNGVTSLSYAGGVIGIGTNFIDNLYEVSSVSIAQTSVPGIGVTLVSKVTVSLSSYNGISGLGFSNFYGEYSWGKISTPTRINPNQFTSYSNIGGISSSPIVQRFNRLKYIGYSTT